MQKQDEKKTGPPPNAPKETRTEENTEAKITTTEEEMVFTLVESQKRKGKRSQTKTSKAADTQEEFP